MSLSKYAETVAILIGRSLGDPTLHASVIVAEYLLRLIGSDVATDVREYRDQLKERMSAKTVEQQGRANLVMAQAQKAANEATPAKRSQAEKKLDEDKQRLEIAKTEADIEKVKAETENIRRASQVEAFERLVAATERVKAKGGEVMFDPDNLNAIIGSPVMGNLTDQTKDAPSSEVDDASE